MAATTPPLTLQDFLKLPDIEESLAWEFVGGQAIKNQCHSLPQHFTEAPNCSN